MKKHVFPSFREIGKIKKDVKDDDRETDNKEPRKRVEGKEEMQSKPCTQGNEQGGQGFREHLAKEGEGGDFQNMFVKQIFRDDPKKSNLADGKTHAQRAQKIGKNKTYNDVHRGSRKGENREGLDSFLFREHRRPEDGFRDEEKLVGTDEEDEVIDRFAIIIGLAEPKGHEFLATGSEADEDYSDEEKLDFPDFYREFL